jgi:branched-chain amino acid transport system substrate-binding protein
MLRSEFLSGALMAAAAPGAAPLQPPVAQQSTLGVNVPLTGPLGPYGLDIARGVQAAIDETNRFSTTLTRVWGLRSYDDRNTVAVAQSNVFVAASDPSVIGMIGNLAADITIATLPQYANASFAVVVPCTTADAVTAQNLRNVFRLPTKDSDEGRLFAKYALAKHKGAAVVAVTIDKDFGFDTARGFVAQAKADKHQADILTFPPTGDPANDAGVILEHTPGYVFLSGRPDRLGPVASQLRTRGYTGDIGAGDGFYTAATTDTYAKDLDGSLVCSSFPPLDRIPTDVTLLTDFRGEVGSITAFAAFGYAAAQLLIAAAQRANATNRFQLLSQLQGGGSYNLLIGQYAFDLNGDAVLPNLYFFRVTANGFKYVDAAVPTGFVV